MEQHWIIYYVNSYAPPVKVLKLVAYDVQDAVNKAINLGIMSSSIVCVKLEILNEAVETN